MDPKQTPMMKQYMEIKKRHGEEILFFRMGDFYEMFFEDAVIASKVLDIALTSRQNDIPMCGIPYHAAESYIARLIKAGKRIAICEQLETVPSSGNIVKRDVVRIITPGTVIESNLLQSDDNNFLASVIIEGEGIAAAFVDISTGDFFISSMPKSSDMLRAELTKFQPSEAVLREGDEPDDEKFNAIVRERNVPIYRINEWLYDTDYMTEIICETYRLANIKGLGLNSEPEIRAAGSIIQYLKETHKQAFEHLKFPRLSISSDYMFLDDTTIANLELMENSQDRSHNRTLFSVLNHTGTPMGKRCLERNILHPLVNRDEIEKRLDIVQYLFEYHELAGQIHGTLKNISDIERLITRFTMGKTFPRNFIALRNSIFAADYLKGHITDQPHDGLRELGKSIPGLRQLAERIEKTIHDDPALAPDQGRVIRSGFSAELDSLYDLKTNAKNWILEYQEEEKQKLGVTTLKIKYNKILGYYIEISKAQAKNIPEEYYRKQTLVGSERYTTEKLQTFESEILTASEKIVAMEKEEIESLRKEIVASQKQLQEMAGVVGDIDFFCALSFSAMENRFVRPSFTNEPVMQIKEGRHPVVEKYHTEEVFVPNDIFLDDDENIISIITGPNMSGKSTYIRMAAVIQLMAQTGSFVPAKEAHTGIVDRIFTRIGASDNISRGESTFLVEMNETAGIINNATPRSLIIMDEVGRGTSTYDGLSIAWAIVEYILRYIRAKTLFATHYHELTSLGSRKGIVNHNVLVKEHLSGVDFLHKVARGAADKSYGIHVANLAGIPSQIITRARKILDRLEKNPRGGVSDPGNNDIGEEQLQIFNAANHLVIQAIEKIDLETITPLEALNELNRLKKMIE